MLWSNISYANYKCSYDVWFKVGSDGELRKKNIKMSVDLVDKKQLKIFDHEIDLYYDNFLIIENNARYIHAIGASDSFLRIFTFNKKNKYSQWASLRNKGSTTIHHGYCK
tara:strand:- start:221 stop:550 length:330 start_codon:yes stop_codon:yes gene_type:complete